MFHNRPCGCKGQRSCLACEAQFGAFSVSGGISDHMKAYKKHIYLIISVGQETSVVFCPHCELAWPGWGVSDWQSHPQHKGQPVQIEGVKLVLDFVTEDEEAELLEKLDQVPWDTSQSGRLKQNYGPKCNFKKRKVKLDGFNGYPLFTKFLQDRFRDVDILRDFLTVEQCSLDYTPSRGASIDPHIDDCWIWGERIPTLSLMSDSVLTLTLYEGRDSRYNLPDVKTYPSVVSPQGLVKTMDQLREYYNGGNSAEEELGRAVSLDAKGLDCSQSAAGSPAPRDHSTTLSSAHASRSQDACSRASEVAISSQEISSEGNRAVKPTGVRVVRVPMPRRSLLVLYGSARYDYEHRVMRDDVPQRRVCITYR
ncbi:hypothetical protein HAZT_HAZT007180 [Hyalella azteca]|uniref:Uncharacterized protein n=1 Tax=Hyalella azteca TaxID=294128 RepID=A0A6A0H8U3_HYAAZ|nr:hypothetical protein HAZT_HAZT007180 [Hyalella azteca]